MMRVMLTLLDKLGQPVGPELPAVMDLAGQIGRGDMMRWQLTTRASWSDVTTPIRAIAVSELPEQPDTTGRRWLVPSHVGLMHPSGGRIIVTRLDDLLLPGLPGNPDDMTAPNPFADTDDDGTLTVERERQQLWGAEPPAVRGGIRYMRDGEPSTESAVIGPLQPPITLRVFAPGTVTWDGSTLVAEYDQPVQLASERRARVLLARHFRVLASAVNVTDWPGYIRKCADAHDAGAAYLDRELVQTPEPKACTCVTSGPDMDGPDELCPEHGRTPDDWSELVAGLREHEDELCEQLRAAREALRVAVSPADAPRWRVGRTYPEHVYAGDTPVATFVGDRDTAAANARTAVLSHNRQIPGIPDGEWVVIPPMGWGNRITELLREHGVDPYATPSPDSSRGDDMLLGAALVGLIREWGVQG